MPDYSQSFSNLPDQQKEEKPSEAPPQKPEPFDIDEYTGESTFVRLLIKYSFGLVTSEEQANYIGIGAAIIIIIISLLIAF